VKPALFIDLDKCRNCRNCSAPCSYRLHPGNDGIAGLRETAEFAVICRHCADPPCVKACPSAALESGPDGVPVRHKLRCVACRSCSQACPFGSILPELMRIEPAVCDLCLGRLGDGESPACVEGCGEGSIMTGDFEPDAPRSFVSAAGGHLIVRAIPWRMGTDS
jgi:Fe-S-cluster-containing dehydrogenase component